MDPSLCSRVLVLLISYFLFFPFLSFIIISEVIFVLCISALIWNLRYGFLFSIFNTSYFSFQSSDYFSFFITYLHLGEAFRIFSLPLVFWNFTKMVFFFLSFTLLDTPRTLCGMTLQYWSLVSYILSPISIFLSFVLTLGYFLYLYFNTSGSLSYFSSKCSDFFSPDTVVLWREQPSVFSLRILLNYKFWKFLLSLMYQSGSQ